MAKIKVTLPLGDELFTGKLVAFQAPRCSSDTTGLVVNGVAFDIVDATEHIITGKDGIWNAGAMVTVMLRMDAKRAYLQSTSIADVAADLAEHTGDEEKHITAEERTAWNGKADGEHKHDAGDIESGILPVSRGGTGRNTFTSGAALIGNGTSGFTTKPITNNAGTSSSFASTNLITGNTLRYAINRTTSVAAADTNYAALMARGMSLNSAETTPAVNGAIAWQYK